MVSTVITGTYGTVTYAVCMTMWRSPPGRPDATTAHARDRARLIWVAMKLLPDRLRGPMLTVYERRLVQLMDTTRLPRHVAIICDGNRRWAREAGFEDVSHGHRVGARRIADMLGWCAELGIETVTIYLLSTENLQR